MIQRPNKTYRAAVILAVALLANLTLALAEDWPMRGRNQSRNAVVPNGVGPTDWQVAGDGGPAKNVRWTAPLGTNSWGDPVIAGGLVWVGTNNPYPGEGQWDDASVLMCFDEDDGQLLYKYVSPRLPGRIGINPDWPGSSLASSPLIEGNRLWFCTNHFEVVCLDVAPLMLRTGEPKVVWKVDLRSQLGIVPLAVHIGSHLSHCSIAGYRDLIYVNTANGAAGDLTVPAPDAPSFVCLQKSDGAVRWKDNSPGKDIMFAQHGSPLVAEVMGRAQVIMGQGDGWVRGFDALTGELLWKFDINPKKAKRGYRFGELSDLVGIPVFHEGRVFFATGRTVEACEGQGRACCVDPSKRGDISSELADEPGVGRPNPNSGVVWEYRGGPNRGDLRMSLTQSSVVIHNGLLVVPDCHGGIIHCLHARSGKLVWTHDAGEGAILGSPLIVGDKVYVAHNDGFVLILELSREKRLIAKREMGNAIDAGAAFANGVLYVMTRDKLFAIGK